VTCTEFRASPRYAAVFVASAPSHPAPADHLEHLSESLRFVVCARPGCGSVFFLCRHCDQGRRYCGTGCAHAARRASLDGARRRLPGESQGAGAPCRPATTLSRAATPGDRRDASPSHEPAARGGVRLTFNGVHHGVPARPSSPRTEQRPPRRLRPLRSAGPFPPPRDARIHGPARVPATLPLPSAGPASSGSSYRSRASVIPASRRAGADAERLTLLRMSPRAKRGVLPCGSMGCVQRGHDFGGDLRCLR
jgi:hypothetical protein